MDIDEFQRYALRSVALPKGSISALSHRSLGITGEAGILANQIKRIVRDKNGKADDQDIEIIKERLGDIFYYAAVLAEYYDIRLSDVLDANVHKSDAFRAARKE